MNILCILCGVLIGLILKGFAKNKNELKQLDNKEEIYYYGKTPMFITENGHTYPHPDNPNFETLKPNWKSSNKF